MSSFQLICLLFTLFSFGETHADSPCGEWEPYKDEKCIKIFNEPGLLDYENAENFCKSTDESNLVSIGFEEKQQFFANFLKSQEIVDNVWIGLKFVDGEYQWADETEVHYTNWAANSPKNGSSYCVQIQTDDDEFAKWSDVQCTKKNLVICEKIQSWALSHLQTAVIDLQFALNQTNIQVGLLLSALSQSNARISQLETEVKTLDTNVNDISKNPFPIGYIYVQLPNEKAPSEIWSWMTWQNVSPNYAGVFFRAEGGNATAFGTVQEENSPRLTNVKWYFGNYVPGSASYDITVQANGVPSHHIDTRNSENKDVGHTFTVSGGEVRPRNMAIRVWKRTA